VTCAYTRILLDVGQGCEALMQVHDAIPRITGFLKHQNPGFQAAAFNALAALHQNQRELVAMQS